MLGRCNYWTGKISQSLNAANPYPVPTPSRWHPLPATADAYTDSGGEDWEVVPEVMKASKVVEVIKAREVASWKERAMVECMYGPPSVGHACSDRFGRSVTNASRQFLEQQRRLLNQPRR
jgi:hypothetical protein